MATAELSKFAGILSAALSQHHLLDVPDVQAALEKAKEAEIKLPTSAGSLIKEETSRKTSTSPVLTMPKP